MEGYLRELKGKGRAKGCGWKFAAESPFPERLGERGACGVENRVGLCAS